MPSMPIKKARHFELRLGRLGVTLFTLGVSCLLLVAFVLGVMVGKNIETYPGKITGAIPGLIREKIAKTPVEPGVAAGPVSAREAAGGGKEDLKLTFYDTLEGKKTSEAVGEKALIKEKPAPQESPPAKDKYIVRVASLKDEKKAQSLQKKLSDLGYPSTLDITELEARGKFYRVSLEGFETKDEAQKVVDLLYEKAKLKCMVVNAK